MERQVARDISYAFSARSRGGRALIRTVENATGRLRLIRRADGYHQAVAGGRDFWEEMVSRYGLSLEIAGGSLDLIPQDGPLVMVANHPYGILDGLMMGYILSRLRSGDFRILANSVFRNSPELDRVVLPIDFGESRAAVETNLATRAEALRYLGQGGAIGVFPGGTVSTSAKPFSRPLDPVWRAFTAKMIQKSGATVIPIFFEGANSRLFQIASHLHTTLRLALLIQEFRRRVDEPVRVVIGAPISRTDMSPYGGDQKALMDFLRARTYALSPGMLDSRAYGFEFEAKHKANNRRAEGDVGRDFR
ncbi:acyltransferase [Silicimonas algicola]|uniref:Putative hemolysin n=1 Tax=Silicimonas algicola TaxID=1826607 RepID=A0A316G9N4_9RHOB|nr:lysophospholipid acyltransferase family protein [Silicimonas algicola]AZQ67250.1 acyltransferase [Silicimonas algicola]PWK56915.1 putative hemolysin [Silicimonas algicola]